MSESRIKALRRSVVRALDGMDGAAFVDGDAYGHEADLVLAYDGGEAYDLLSYQGDGPAFYGLHGPREAVAKAAHAVGFRCEDLNGWSMGFYKD